MFSKQTKEMLVELDRIALLPYRWNQEEIISELKKFYALYGMEFPKKIVKLIDIFDPVLKDIFEKQAGQAWQARQAGQARQARQAWQAGQAGQAGQARQARQAGQAGQARQARQAWQAGQAGQAGQARQAIDYASDYWEGDALIFVQEYAAENSINEHDKKFMDGQRILLAAKELGLGFFVDGENGTLYLIPCATVRLNTNNLHHSDNFPAIEWKDGAKFYYLNGVNFPEGLWKEIVSGKMPFAEILKIADIDQRTQAMKYGNVEEFLNYVDAKVLDTYQKFLPTGEPLEYRLYEIPHSDKSPFTSGAYYMRYTCPSTLKDYMSGVYKPEKPEQLTVPHMMSWKFSCSEDEWKRLVPGVTES